MKNISLIGLLFLFAQTFIFSQGTKKALLFEIELFQKEVGILDPLFLNISFGNRGRREISVFPPDGRNMLVEVKRVEEEKWWEIELFKGWIVGENDFKVPIPSGSSSIIPQKFSAPRDSAEFVWMPAKTPQNLFFNNYCFKPGKYKLRIKYFYSSLSQDRREKQSLVRMLEFEVTNYKNTVDQEAYKWLMQLEHPGLFYNPEVAIYQSERWLEIGDEFLQLFPLSKFSPFVHYGMVMALAHLRLTEHWDEKAFKYHKKQVQETQNPYLISEIERYYQN